MPRVKVAVEKQVAFKAGSEIFSNVYTYDAPSLEDSELNQLADAVVVNDKQLHSTDVTYRNVKVWNIEGVPNVMRVSKQVTGTGSASPSSGMYRECAYLFTWPLPSRITLNKRRRRDLRKWYHSCSNLFGSDTKGTGALNPPTAGNPVFTALQALESPRANTFLCAPNGDRPTGPWVLHPYLEHRQFPRGRKEGNGIL